MRATPDTTPISSNHGPMLGSLTPNRYGRTELRHNRPSGEWARLERRSARLMEKLLVTYDLDDEVISDAEAGPELAYDVYGVHRFPLVVDTTPDRTAELALDVEDDVLCERYGNHDTWPASRSGDTLALAWAEAGYGDGRESYCPDTLGGIDSLVD
jgi:hypothetical protein